MDADNLATFNADKAAAQVALWPATVTFQKTGATAYSVSFGETVNDGGLAESGQAVGHHRVGWLYFPEPVNPATFRPSLLQTFTITAASGQPALVGLKYQVEEIASSPGEPVTRCRCRRIEE